MKRLIVLMWFAFAGAGLAQIKIDLSHLAARASDTVDVSLDGSLLEIAGKFLSSEKPDEARVKSLISGLKGIYVKSFEFDKQGAWSQSDLEPIRKQLAAPGWVRIASVTSKADGESTEIFLRTEGGKTAGLAVLAAEPRELTIVQILGPIDLEQLSELGGRFGIPEIRKPQSGKAGSKKDD